MLGQAERLRAVRRLHGLRPQDVAAGVARKHPSVNDGGTYHGVLLCTRISSAIARGFKAMLVFPRDLRYRTRRLAHHEPPLDMARRPLRHFEARVP